VETIERRVAWVAVTLAILLAFSALNGLAYSGGELGKGELAVYLAGIFALGIAAVLLVAALAPEFVRPFTLDQRARFVFFAFVLVVSAIVTTIALHAHFAIDAVRHPER
jgi:hypothetical protein